MEWKHTNIEAMEEKEGDGKDFQKCLIKSMLYIYCAIRKKYQCYMQ